MVEVIVASSPLIAATSSVHDVNFVEDINYEDPTLFPQLSSSLGIIERHFYIYATEQIEQLSYILHSSILRRQLELLFLVSASHGEHSVNSVRMSRTAFKIFGTALGVTNDENNKNASDENDFEFGRFQRHANIVLRDLGRAEYPSEVAQYASREAKRAQARLDVMAHGYHKLSLVDIVGATAITSSIAADHVKKNLSQHDKNNSQSHHESMAENAIKEKTHAAAPHPTSVSVSWKECNKESFNNGWKIHLMRFSEVDFDNIFDYVIKAKTLMEVILLAIDDDFENLRGQNQRIGKGKMDVVSPHFLPNKWSSGNDEVMKCGTQGLNCDFSASKPIPELVDSVMTFEQFCLACIEFAKHMVPLHQYPPLTRPDLHLQLMECVFCGPFVREFISTQIVDNVDDFHLPPIVAEAVNQVYIDLLGILFTDAINPYLLQSMIVEFDKRASASAVEQLNQAMPMHQDWFMSVFMGDVVMEFEQLHELLLKAKLSSGSIRSDEIYSLFNLYDTRIMKDRVTIDFNGFIMVLLHISFGLAACDIPNSYRTLPTIVSRFHYMMKKYFLKKYSIDARIFFVDNALRVPKSLKPLSDIQTSLLARDLTTGEALQIILDSVKPSRAEKGTTMWFFGNYFPTKWTPRGQRCPLYARFGKVAQARGGCTSSTVGMCTVPHIPDTEGARLDAFIISIEKRENLEGENLKPLEPPVEISSTSVITDGTTTKLNNGEAGNKWKQTVCNTPDENFKFAEDKYNFSLRVENLIDIPVFISADRLQWTVRSDITFTLSECSLNMDIPYSVVKNLRILFSAFSIYDPDFEEKGKLIRGEPYVGLLQWAEICKRCDMCVHEDGNLDTMFARHRIFFEVARKRPMSIDPDSPAVDFNGFLKIVFRYFIQRYGPFFSLMENLAQATQNASLIAKEYFNDCQTKRKSSFFWPWMVMCEKTPASKYNSAAVRARGGNAAYLTNVQMGSVADVVQPILSDVGKRALAGWKCVNCGLDAAVDAGQTELLQLKCICEGGGPWEEGVGGLSGHSEQADELLLKWFKMIDTEKKIHQENNKKDVLENKNDANNGGGVSVKKLVKGRKISVSAKLPTNRAGSLIRKPKKLRITPSMVPINCEGETKFTFSTSEHPLSGSGSDISKGLSKHKIENNSGSEFDTASPLSPSSQVKKITEAIIRGMAMLRIRDAEVPPEETEFHSTKEENVLIPFYMFRALNALLDTCPENAKEDDIPAAKYKKMKFLEAMKLSQRGRLYYTIGLVDRLLTSQNVALIEMDKFFYHSVKEAKKLARFITLQACTLQRCLTAISEGLGKIALFVNDTQQLLREERTLCLPSNLMSSKTMWTMCCYMFDGIRQSLQYLADIARPYVNNEVNDGKEVPIELTFAEANNYYAELVAGCRELDRDLRAHAQGTFINRETEGGAETDEKEKSIPHLTSPQQVGWERSLLSCTSLVSSCLGDNLERGELTSLSLASAQENSNNEARISFNETQGGGASKICSTKSTALPPERREYNFLNNAIQIQVREEYEKKLLELELQLQNDKQKILMALSALMGSLSECITSKKGTQGVEGITAVGVISADVIDLCNKVLEQEGFFVKAKDVKQITHEFAIASTGTSGVNEVTVLQNNNINNGIGLSDWSISSMIVSAAANNMEGSTTKIDETYRPSNFFSGREIILLNVSTQTVIEEIPDLGAIVSSLEYRGIRNACRCAPGAFYIHRGLSLASQALQDHEFNPSMYEDIHKMLKWQVQEVFAEFFLKRIAINFNDFDIWHINRDGQENGIKRSDGCTQTALNACDFADATRYAELELDLEGLAILVESSVRNVNHADKGVHNSLRKQKESSRGITTGSVAPGTAGSREAGITSGEGILSVLEKHSRKMSLHNVSGTNPPKLAMLPTQQLTDLSQVNTAFPPPLPLSIASSSLAFSPITEPQRSGPLSASENEHYCALQRRVMQLLSIKNYKEFQKMQTRVKYLEDECQTESFLLDSLLQSLVQSVKEVPPSGGVVKRVTHRNVMGLSGRGTQEGKIGGGASMLSGDKTGDFSPKASESAQQTTKARPLSSGFGGGAVFPLPLSSVSMGGKVSSSDKAMNIKCKAENKDQSSFKDVPEEESHVIAREEGEVLYLHKANSALSSVTATTANMAVTTGVTIAANTTAAIVKESQGAAHVDDGKKKSEKEREFSITNTKEITESVLPANNEVSVSAQRKSSKSTHPYTSIRDHLARQLEMKKVKKSSSKKSLSKDVEAGLLCAVETAEGSDDAKSTEESVSSLLPLEVDERNSAVGTTIGARIKVEKHSFSKVRQQPQKILEMGDIYSNIDEKETKAFEVTQPLERQKKSAYKKVKKDKIRNGQESAESTPSTPISEDGESHNKIVGRFQVPPVILGTSISSPVTLPSDGQSVFFPPSYPDSPMFFDTGVSPTVINGENVADACDTRLVDSFPFSQPMYLPARNYILVNQCIRRDEEYREERGLRDAFLPDESNKIDGHKGERDVLIEESENLNKKIEKKGMGKNIKEQGEAFLMKSGTASDDNPKRFYCTQTFVREFVIDEKGNYLGEKKTVSPSHVAAVEKVVDSFSGEINVEDYCYSGRGKFVKPKHLDEHIFSLHGNKEMNINSITNLKDESAHERIKLQSETQSEGSTNLPWTGIAFAKPPKIKVAYGISERGEFFDPRSRQKLTETHDCYEKFFEDLAATQKQKKATFGRSLSELQELMKITGRSFGVDGREETCQRDQDDNDNENLNEEKKQGDARGSRKKKQTGAMSVEKILKIFKMRKHRKIDGNTQKRKSDEEASDGNQDFVKAKKEYRRAIRRMEELGDSTDGWNIRKIPKGRVIHLLRNDYLELLTRVRGAESIVAEKDLVCAHLLPVMRRYAEEIPGANLFLRESASLGLFELSTLLEEELRRVYHLRLMKAKQCAKDNLEKLHKLKCLTMPEQCRQMLEVWFPDSLQQLEATSGMPVTKKTVPKQKEKNELLCADTKEELETESWTNMTKLAEQLLLLCVPFGVHPSASIEGLAIGQEKGNTLSEEEKEKNESQQDRDKGNVKKKNEEKDQAPLISSLVLLTATEKRSLPPHSVSTSVTKTVNEENLEKGKQRLFHTFVYKFIKLFNQMMRISESYFTDLGDDREKQLQQRRQLSSATSAAGTSATEESINDAIADIEAILHGRELRRIMGLTSFSGDSEKKNEDIEECKIKQTEETKTKVFRTSPKNVFPKVSVSEHSKEQRHSLMQTATTIKHDSPPPTFSSVKSLAFDIDNYAKKASLLGAKKGMTIPPAGPLLHVASTNPLPTASARSEEIEPFVGVTGRALSLSSQKTILLTLATSNSRPLGRKRMLPQKPLPAIKDTYGTEKDGKKMVGK